MKVFIFLLLIVCVCCGEEFIDSDTVYVVAYLTEPLTSMGAYQIHVLRCEYKNFGIAEGCLNVKIDDGDEDYRVYIYNLRNISEYTVSRDCIWMGNRMFKHGWLGRIVK